LKRVSILGVLVGGIVDIVSTNVFVIPLFIFAVLGLDRTHIAKGQLGAAAIAAMQHDPSLLIAGFFVGVGGSMLAGYVAALIAKHDETLNGALSAWLCVAIGIFGWSLGAASLPVAYHLLGFVLSPAAGALGGYLRLFQ